MSSLYEQIASLPPEKRELFELMLQEQGVDLSEVMIVPQKRDTNQFPLSYSQQRLWFLDQLEPGSSLYNIPSVIRLNGSLNVEALVKSFNEVVKRHEVLRTTFTTVDNNPIQVIAETLNIQTPVIDLQNIPEAERDEEITKLAVEEANKSFNLQEGPLLRVTLLKLKNIEHVLMFTVHHIVSDNWSTGLFVHEILRLYEAFSNNKPSPLPDLTVQYADFSFWQRKWLKGKTLEKQVDYWKEALAGIPPVLEMPLDRPRPSYQTYNGDFITFTLSKEVTNALNDLSRKEDVTLFMTLLTAFQTLLFRYSGQNDICVGSPIANRNRAETEQLIGFFINTLVLRAGLSDNPAFNELLAQIKETMLGAYAHQDLPFETLVEELHPERDMSHSPLFQVMFVLNNAPVETLQLAGLKFDLIEIENKSAKFDLILNITETDQTLAGKLEFNTDLYNHSTMERFIEHFNILINGVIADPQMRVSDLPLLTKDERQTILSNWNLPPKIYDEKLCIHELFQNQAGLTPEAAALTANGQKLTYKELNDKSNQLANHLIKTGFKTGTIAGICAERSAEMIIGLIAVLKAGGVYLPLDPGYPKERLDYMLEDSEAPYLLTQQSLLNEFSERGLKIISLDSDWGKIETESAANPGTKINPGDAAYIIYTSGSTGKPKGVLVGHKAIANHCCDMRDYYELSVDDNVLQFAALNFDASLEQILPTLISGASLVMRDEEIWATSEFHKKVNEHSLTVINLPTAYWRQLANEWSKSPELIPQNLLRLIIIGGDLMGIEALNQWQKTQMNGVRLLNAYGPTETIITATTFEIPADFNQKTNYSRIPIGKQRANREIYVLDSFGNPVPVGAPGELHIGGGTMAKGYLNRPELTAEQFIANRFNQKPGERLYKTGDLVRFLPNGNLEFLGRVDQQVKIRGFRIELGEIETALRQFPAIDEAVVIALEDKPGEKRLAAYYVSKENTDPSINELRSFLKNKLPEYFIPSVFMALDSMPLSPAGKINRKALPKPDQERPELSAVYVEPRTPTEEKLADIVKEVLDIKRVGIYDNFFELGGHSMLGTQVISQIRDIFEVEVPLRALFENPTVEGIAHAITEIQAEAQDEEDLEQMLDELENLSDEEVERMLREEEENSPPKSPSL